MLKTLVGNTVQSWLGESLTVQQARNLVLRLLAFYAFFWAGLQSGTNPLKGLMLLSWLRQRYCILPAPWLVSLDLSGCESSDFSVPQVLTGPLIGMASSEV